MRRFIGCLGVAAMLSALLTAPMFHSHDQDDHGHTTSFVHAHFAEEPEHDDHHEGASYENAHGHHGRSVDYFTVNLPLQGVHLAIDPETQFSAPELAEQPDVVLMAVPRAHGPPSLHRSVPRSPPPTL